MGNFSENVKVTTLMFLCLVFKPDSVYIYQHDMPKFFSIRTKNILRKYFYMQRPIIKNTLIAPTPTPPTLKRVFPLIESELEIELVYFMVKLEFYIIEIS